MSNPFIGEIRCFGFNFAPNGWAMCNGQLMDIATNTALFSLLGTLYGGDGQTTFALPNLQGKVAMHFGANGGNPNHFQGETGGEDTHTLLTTQIPAHNHGIGGGADQDTNRPSGAVAARGGVYAKTRAPLHDMAPTDTIGGSQPHNNLQPYLVLNYCISLFGIFPSRN
jgi:microcystin-dependent protein